MNSKIPERRIGATVLRQRLSASGVRLITAAAVRDFLGKPIRANRFAKDDPQARDRKIRDETWARIEAAFILYRVPSDLPEALQWRELALAALGELFAGCRTIQRGIGGKKREPEENYLKLLGEFHQFVAGRGREGKKIMDNVRLFRHFRGGIVSVGNQKIGRDKALLNAIRRGQRERERRQSAAPAK